MGVAEFPCRTSLAAAAVVVLPRLARMFLGFWGIAAFPQRLLVLPLLSRNRNFLFAVAAAAAAAAGGSYMSRVILKHRQPLATFF